MMEELSALEKIGGEHPKVLRVMELLHDNEKYYISTELCPGGELFDHLQKHGRFKERKAVYVLKQILQAISFMHSRKPPMAHRDLKPENILLSDTSVLRPEIKIADFGFATLIEGEALSRKVGTSCYMAPELI